MVEAEGRPVKKLVIDCDGVLTDGTLTINLKGEKLFKKFHTRDVRAIREFVANGWEVVILSADDWGGTAHFAEKVGAEFRVSRTKDDIGGDYVAIGDDVWDRALLEGATRAFCPNDADPLLFREIPTIEVVRRDGGRGVVAEVLRWHDLRGLL